MRNKSWKAVILSLVLTAGFSWTCAEHALSIVYNECKIPPQISVAFIPNILLVMDYSGSMQFPAYVGGTGSYTTPGSLVYSFTNTTDGAYNPATYYYGYFKSDPDRTKKLDTYYKYNSTATASNPGGYFYMSGGAPDGGVAGDNGTFETGISGNILNWLLMSRMDAALMALVGGKAYGLTSAGADCDCEDTQDSNNCYLSAQGSRRTIRESTNIDAEFYVRPTDWKTADYDNWDDSNKKYPTLEIVVNSTASYRGQLTNADDRESGTCKRYYEVWKLVLDKATSVNLELYESFFLSSNDAYGYLAITSDAAGTTVLYEDFGRSGWPSHPRAVLNSSNTAALPAGTYYVKVAPSTSYCGSQGSYALTSNVNLTAYGPDTGKNSGTLVNKSVGPITNARVRVQIAQDERSGAITEAWQQANWGFMWYNGGYGDGISRQGRLLVRCGGYISATNKVDTPGKFAKYLEGKLKVDGTAATDGIPFAYNSTPSGEALQEAENYFQQAGGINSGLFAQGTEKDPFYAVVNNEVKSITCRKSYVILVSDGVWNGSVDPYRPAFHMHRTDLRSLAGEQFADVFSIFAFGTGNDLTQGTRSLKWAAMYGGFSDLTASTACKTGFPYPMTSSTNIGGSNSKDQAFPPTTGNCDTTSANACCKEWTSGTAAEGRLGWPDNYFQATSGDELVTAIRKIVGQISQKTASSSAVATVAQQTGDGDMVIRAMFEAMPPGNPPVYDGVNSDKLLWFGHMEAYWPNTDGYYDFELSAKKPYIMCKDNINAFGTTGTNAANCWDAAMPSSLNGPFPGYGEPSGTLPLTSLSPSIRRIFTVKGHDTTIPRTMYWFNKTNISAKGDTNGDLGLGLDTSVTPSSSNPAPDVLIDWVLGKDKTTTTDYALRTRTDKDAKSWILGDVVYSTPVVVGPPALGGISQDAKVLVDSREVNAIYKTGTSGSFNKFYLDWRQVPKLKYRDKVVYVGGNDGMLHAFLMAKWWPVNDPAGAYITKHGGDNTASETDKTKWTHPDVGKEIWAYIPSNLLTELKTLANTGYAHQAGGTCQHRFMVDLAPRAFEVIFQDKVTTTMTATKDGNLDHWPWRTVLLGGERGGGDLYFALDVSDPYNPKVLWEFSVLRNMVANFDFEGALPAFLTACFNNTKLTPGDITTCQAPQLPTDWWNSHCDKCACKDTGCTEIGDPSDCRTQLTQMNLEDATWLPFNNNNLYNAAKKLPVSWSRPYVGRVGFPSDLKVMPCDPHQTSVPGPTKGSACYPKCGGSTGDPDGYSGVRNFAFIGGGIRLFDLDVDFFPSDWQQFYKDGFKNALNGTFVLALDLETGTNAFRYIWPQIFKASKTAGYQKDQNRIWDETTKKWKYQTPYAMSDPVVLDVWDRANSMIGEDGYADYIYVADMNGLLYGIKMNFDPTATTTAGETGIYVDLWKTKPIPLNDGTGGTKDYASNFFRSRLQPFTIQPSVSIERDTVTGDPHLRVIIAGGKHEDVSEGTANDSSDVAKMSLYNLRDKIQMPTVASFTNCGTYDTEKSCSNVETGTITYTTPTLPFVVRSNCEQPSSGTAWDKETATDQRYRCKGEGTESTCQYSVNIEDANGNITGTTTWSGCRWMKPDATNSLADASDCCEADCDTSQTPPATPCWKCVYDLIDSGEKVINKPLIAGGVVFITTFSPFAQSDDVCKAGGVSYLYAFEYMCKRFPDGFRPLQDTTSYTIKANSSGSQIYGQRASLGLGVASQPVLDSTGNYLIIQNSLGEIKRQNVTLPTNMADIKGWKEK